MTWASVAGLALLIAFDLGFLAIFAWAFRMTPNDPPRPIGQRTTELGWTCHVCGAERDDASVSVAVYRVPLFGAAPVSLQARYCNDRIECLAGTAAVLAEWAKPLRVKQ